MQRWASKHKIMVINTDTSPRNLGSDFEKGYGAGFYLDATVCSSELNRAKNLLFRNLYGRNILRCIPTLFMNLSHICSLNL